MADNKQIFTKITEQIEADIYHGASLALYDGVSWRESYFGTQDGNLPTTADLTYDLASVSKVVGVGTLCIFLINSGALSLDKSLKDYYPDFHDDSVTLRQLLTHSSGINPFIPNRDSLNASQLKEAINHIEVTEDKSFKYTDINFLLLGFMLENLFNSSLDKIFREQIFETFTMTETSFGSVTAAVPTIKGVSAGTVHDPKAQVLEIHAGSAGLFSTIKDLERFVNHYLADEFAAGLSQNYSRSNKERSLAWDLQGKWLLHTGYTGTFILLNIEYQRAAIFLSNRTYEKDERSQWIKDRDELISIIKEVLLKND
ncbi:serine hydrolase domain-containing protein [Streptococcus dentiloxodontae]